MTLAAKIEVARRVFVTVATEYADNPTDSEAWRELCRGAATLKALVNCGGR